MNRISKKRLKKIAIEIALCHETLDVMASESINKITENDLIGILEKTHNLLNTSEVNSVDEFKELYK